MSRPNRIAKSIGQDVPSLTEVLLRVVDSQAGVSPFGRQPLSVLCAHLSSLNEICEQALYAMDRLRIFSCKRPATPSDLHAKYHLYGFLSRVKTGTDIVALTLNAVFELGLQEEDCSLEKGSVCKALRQCAHHRQRHGVMADQLAATLDRARNDWIKPFYDFRNLVIHRNGVALVRAPHPESHEYYAFLAPAVLLAATDDRQVVEHLVIQLDLVEQSLVATTAIDPVHLCEQLWTRLAVLVNSVLGQLHLCPPSQA
jgi:hypothetical protein